MSIPRSRLRLCPIAFGSLALCHATLGALAAAFGLSSCDAAASPPAGGLATPGLALLNSDYKSSSVSLYNPTSHTLIDDCVPSTTLSKDVAMPTGFQHGELVVIDRASSVIDFVNPAVCAVRAQLSVSTGGFKANPHDVVNISSTKAYVARYEKNAAPTPDPSDFDDGDDLLIIDPSVPKVIGRIGLTTYATGAMLQARPDRALLANGLVYVALNSLSADFSADGPGRVVVVDPTTDTVTGMIDLPDQTGCSGLAYADATKKLYVTCGGEFGDADETATSALVEIDLSGATPALGRIVTGKSLGTQPVSYTAAVLLDGIAYIETAGALDFTTNKMTAPDTLYGVALATGTPTKVVDGGAFNLGRPALDAESKTLFLPDGDATTPRVRVFDVSGATAVAGTPFEPNPADHLPPREAAWY
jgi:hypothetical protein